MSNTSNHHAAMTNLVEEAWSVSSSHADEPINDEHLTMLAMGESHRLAEGDREKLLAQVAAQPWAQQALADYQELDFTAEEADTSTASPTSSNHASPIVFAIRAGWAIAACLTLMFGLWEVVSPAAAQPGFTPMGVDSTVVATSDPVWRSYVLAIFGCLWLVLSIPFIWSFKQAKEVIGLDSVG